MRAAPRLGDAHRDVRIDAHLGRIVADELLVAHVPLALPTGGAEWLIAATAGELAAGDGSANAVAGASTGAAPEP